MVPSAFTLSEWQSAQDAAVTGAAMARWPVGGMPWHEVQVIAVTLVHTGVAFEPVTPLKLKLPWQ
jgi:hypothetical protein